MRSEEECRRLMEEEDRQPHITGLTCGEFQRLTPREKSRALQRITQIPASFLGYWKGCSLSSCRRAKRCKGFLTEAQYSEGGYHTSFPPCLGKGAPRHAEILDAMRRLARVARERKGQV